MEIPANPDPDKVNHVWYALVSVRDDEIARLWEARGTTYPRLAQIPEPLLLRDDWWPMFPKHSLELLVEGIVQDEE